MTQYYIVFLQSVDTDMLSDNFESGSLINQFQNIFVFVGVKHITQLNVLYCIVNLLAFILSIFR